MRYSLYYIPAPSVRVLTAPRPLRSSVALILLLKDNGEPFREDPMQTA